jgi:peptidoglycan/LPS O-acetylase OafA/YrhL
VWALGRDLTTRAGRRDPALDGMRALAVLAVMLFHANVSWARGGFLGVDMFFVLSGFLITRLLFTERDRTGRVELPAFWMRRMRRLLPALFVLIAVVAIVLAVGSASNESFRADVAATLGYFANWREIFDAVPYFKQVSAASPLQHTWSLAIEEQFYIAWPLLFVALARLRRYRAAVLGVALGGAAASVAIMTLLAPSGGGDPSRVYFGTDTRAQSLFIGVALAAMLHGAPRATARGRRIFQSVAVLGGVGTLALWGLLGADNRVLFRGGFALAGFATAAIIAGIALHPTGAVARAIGVAPLRALGRISYGVYLWHWPLQLAMTHRQTGLSGPVLIVVRMAATIAVATVSFVVIEQPFRRGVSVPWRTIPGFAAGAIAMIASIAIAFAPPATVAVLAAPPVARSSVDVVVPTVAPTATAVHVSHPRPVVVPHVAPPPYPPHRTAFFGDSVSMSLAKGLVPIGPSYGERVTDDAILGCGVARSGKYKLAGTTYNLAGECASWDAVWTERIKRDRPDVAAIVLGRHEVLDRVYKDRWTNILDDDYAAYVQTEMERAIKIASSTGAHVALLTAPFYRSRERPDGGSWPENDPARVRRVNAIERAVAAHHPGIVRLIDLGGRTSPGGTYAYSVDGVPLRSDGVHFSASGCRWLAPWLLPQFYSLGPVMRVAASPTPPPTPTVPPTPSPSPIATSVPVP